MVDEIVEIGETPDDFFLHVKWDGIPDKRDWTWQRTKELYKDIPDIATSIFSICKKRKVASKVKLQLGIST